jgi:hypothetical protein
MNGSGRNVLSAQNTPRWIPWAVSSNRGRLNAIVIEYPDDPSPAVARQRQELSELVRSGQFDAAADLALRLDDSVLYFTATETIGDHLMPSRPADARILYAAALRSAEWYASCATSGAEGMGRMVEVRRIREKIAELGPA